MQKIPLEILNLQGDGYHLLVEVSLLNKTFKMVLDTGASKTVLDKQILLANGITEEDLQHTDVVSTGLGTNSMQSFTLRLSEFQIASWSTKNFTAAVLDLSAINYAYEQMELPTVIGVLGGDILYHYGAKIDYRTASLSLRKRALKLK